MTLRSLAGAAALLALAAAAPASGQAPRPHLRWRTVETARFTFHYPADAEAWTLDLASRMEGVAEAVGALVESRPRARVTVVVDDPASEANASAWPVLDRPVIYVWPTPAGARGSLGHRRDWTEELAVHEYAHLAHLNRPSRNPRDRLLWRLSPLPAGPVSVRAPRWAAEGYATYIEGRLTGSGRPYSAGRSAVLRQWALEGQLPTYGQLNGAAGYRGGEMAYLAGSAFLEWLIARTGEPSLPNVWRRLSARHRRSFDQAFAGVYGARPAALYGRFTAELTGRALAAERQIAADSLRGGELVLTPQGYGFDDPAVAPDGSRIAVRVRLPGRAGPVVVVRAAADTVTRQEREAQARARQRDPEDVPAREFLPRPRRELARLEPRRGRGFEEPRFFRDGRRVLVSRWTEQGDGTLRPDLYEWTLDGGRVRRLTRGAGIRGADPSPDGREAVGVRCDYGLCALVAADLATGRVRVVVPARLGRMLDRPRYSPDGRSIAVAVQAGGRWRVSLVDGSSGALRDVGPDDGASRYEPEFVGDGRRLLVTSERGGIPNIEEIVAAGAAAPRTLTRVSGAAMAPAAGGGDTLVYFLSLRSDGLELRRLAPSLATVTVAAALDSSLAPAVPPRPRGVVDTLARGPVSAPRPYGLGPRGFRYLPAAAAAREGAFGALALVNADPVSRLSAVAQGGLGSAATWRGAALAAAYRGGRPAVHAEAFAVSHRPRDDRAVAPPPGTALLAGGAVTSTLAHFGDWRTARQRAGVSSARLDLDSAGRVGRTLAFVELGEQLGLRSGGAAVELGARAHGSLGNTGGTPWRRGLAAASARVDAGLTTMELRATVGGVSADAPAFERFALGGMAVPFIERAVLSQRVASPALPVGFAGGRRLLGYRATAFIAGLQLYAERVSAGDRLGGGWTRVAGVEQQAVVGPFGIVGLPQLEIGAGLGYPLDGPFRHEAQLYGAITVRP